MKVLVLTTSYPRTEDEVAGIFVGDYVAALEQAGAEVIVVSPADFPHFGIAYGHGIMQNLRARPWLWAFVPAFLAGFALAARRASRQADVVYAHWLPSAVAALGTGKPFAVQLWGTDVAIARRLHLPARLLLRRARAVVVASDFLAGEARRLGARSIGVVPVPLAIPAEVAEPDDPPHVLFVGRLSEEKGIIEFLEATEGLPRVIVGEGPLAAEVPEALPFVPRRALGRYYERAAVVCAPSRREGYGMVVREAMAYGRPVVATHVGGLADAVTPDTGVLVPVGDRRALRHAIETLLSDHELRNRLGAAARARMADSAREPAGLALASLLA